MIVQGSSMLFLQIIYFFPLYMCFSHRESNESLTRSPTNNTNTKSFPYNHGTRGVLVLIPVHVNLAEEKLMLCDSDTRQEIGSVIEAVAPETFEVMSVIHILFPTHIFVADCTNP
ncbi:hypothetical protein HID58_015588 [Brassica napus]|uniref:Uncharacterized protein n=1 Tax=Brassica napus TaxID=3708 RepID=A0ABQ8DKH5_BRANA|nr:hypothetical protein HID58_015588 [Brassica napus]